MSKPPDASDALSRTELIARLRPGAWSKLGFLGADESLDEVMARDDLTMAHLKLSHAELADALKTVLTSANEIWEKPELEANPEMIPARETDFPNLYQPDTLPQFNLNNLPDLQLGVQVGDLHVFIQTYKGWQDCPWGCKAKGNQDFMILNRKTGEWVTAPELMPHLIGEHHFFEGTGTPFRTDPRQLARVLMPDESETCTSEEHSSE